MKRRYVVKTDKDIPPAWIEQSDEKTRFSIETQFVEEETYASVLEKWKRFYTESLETQAERDKATDLLKHKLCNCDNSIDRELERMNRLAKAIKGDLDKK